MSTPDGSERALTGMTPVAAPTVPADSDCTFTAREQPNTAIAAAARASTFHACRVILHLLLTTAASAASGGPGAGGGRRTARAVGSERPRDTPQCRGRSR